MTPIQFGKGRQTYTRQNRVRLIKGGAEYFALLEELICRAEHSIYIRMYILAEDTTGKKIAGWLAEAARRNVAVFVQADGFASQSLSKDFISQLEKNGVHFKFFEPLLRSSKFYFGRRMHEKVVVIDGKAATVGGINFSDHYNDIENKKAWLDFALYVEGTAAKQLYNICIKGWKKGSSETTPIFTGKDYCIPVSVRQNDWVKGKQNIWRTYFNCFNQSKESITIVCSYFLPGRILMNRLKAATGRGVHVKIMLAGPSDVMTAKYAERFLYRWMVKNNIEIFEYQPSILHAKLMIVDDEFVTIGSYNVNNISTYASTEINLNVLDENFAGLVKKTITQIIEIDCKKITKDQIEKTGLVQRLIQAASYYFIRIILNLTTFYYKQE